MTPNTITVRPTKIIISAANLAFRNLKSTRSTIWKRKPPPSLETGVITYTGPMHPEVRQDHPGHCPKCGMALEPVTVSIEEKAE